MGARVAVAASNRLAADAAVTLAAAGGNAVDAALAAVLVAMVCEPGVVALGAGAFVTVAPPDGSRPVTVDGNVEMPGRGLPADRFGRGVREVTTGYGGGLTMSVGHGSVAVPGALAAFDLASRRFGRLPWAEVLAPAVEVAGTGFPLGAAAATYLGYAHDSVFGWHADSSAALHHPDGRPIGLGETVRVAHLADSLELIAAEGASAFYRGSIAAAIAADMAANDGLLTAADLAAYEPLVQPTLAVRLRDWRLATNPPPAIGGPTLAAMLYLMGDRPTGRWADDDLSHLVAVQDAVLRHRLDHLDVATDRVAAAHELLDRVASGGLAAMSRSPSTVHVSVVDDAATACAVTASAGYGSGVMTPGTGIWLNNSLGEPELNRTGLHAWEPGARLPSNMAPTVGRRDDGAVLAIGSPGADRITTALLQVLAGYANGGSSLQEAIDRPRLHVRHLPGGEALDHGEVLEYEEDLGAPPAGMRTRSHPPHSMFFGGVGAALREHDGSLHAAADPRRAAAVAIGPG